MYICYGLSCKNYTNLKSHSITDLANLSTDDLRYLEVQPVMWTTVSMLIIDVVTFVFGSDPIKIAVAVDMICCYSTVIFSCVFYLQLLPISPDLYDVKKSLSEKEENDLKKEVFKMRLVILIDAAVTVAVTFIIHVLYGFGCLAAAIGLDEFLGVIEATGNCEAALVTYTLCFLCVVVYLSIVIADCQHEIRRYCCRAK